MMPLGAVAVAATALWSSIKYFNRYGKEDISSPKTSAKLSKLWAYVDKASRTGRQRAIEKALLAILRIDHKNTAAYNRLGMLYAKQNNYDDAIDCFAIASSLTPTVATLYNLGLVHYEKGNYKEASTAFERVIDLEPNVKRYIAYAKAMHKLDNGKKVAEALERVVEMEPTPQHYAMLGQAYSQIKEFAKSEEATKEAALLKAKRLQSANRKRARLGRQTS